MVNMNGLMEGNIMANGNKEKCTVWVFLDGVVF